MINSQISNNNLGDLDINNPASKNNIKQEISDESSKLKKNIRVVEDLRMASAEMEVEAAALSYLYHAELRKKIEDLWKKIEDLKTTTDKKTFNK